ncbi:MAG TPA: alpha/beta hydrolase-fold protein [Candidatus Xenobia bacterium]
MHVTGTFNNWHVGSDSRLQAREARRWGGQVNVPTGLHAFKFATDDAWTESWGGWSRGHRDGTLQPDGPNLFLHVPVPGPHQVEVDLDAQAWRIEPVEGGPGPLGALGARAGFAAERLDYLDFHGQLPFLGEDGVLFVMEGDDDRPVSLAGSWNGWSEGVDVIPPGPGPRTLWVGMDRSRPHEYKMVRDGVWFRDPHNRMVVWDGYDKHAVGEFNSVLPPRQGFDNGFLPFLWIKRFPSGILGDERDIFVQLPPNYRTDRRYPVLYVHDGNESITRARFHYRSDETMRAGKCEPVILVYVALPDQRVRNYQYVGADGWPKYVNFLADELVPFIDRYFNTRAEAWSRATIGASLGGAVAWYCSLQRPDVFALGASQSGSFYVNNGDLWRRVEAADPRSVKLYLDSSRKTRQGGGDMARLADAMEQTLKERASTSCTTRPRASGTTGATGPTGCPGRCSSCSRSSEALPGGTEAPGEGDLDPGGRPLGELQKAAPLGQSLVLPPRSVLRIQLHPFLQVLGGRCIGLLHHAAAASGQPPLPRSRADVGWPRKRPGWHCRPAWLPQRQRIAPVLPGLLPPR